MKTRTTEIKDSINDWQLMNVRWRNSPKRPQDVIIGKLEAENIIRSMVNTIRNFILYKMNLKGRTKYIEM